MNSLEIRPMTVDDTEEVAELTSQLGYEVSTSETQERIANLADDGVVLVGVAGGRVVGWIQGLNRRLLIYPQILEVGGLVVDEAHRGNGIGKALIAALAKWGTDSGHTRIFVRSSVLRHGAHRFYEDLGFTREKTSHTFSIEIEQVATGH